MRTDLGDYSTSYTTLGFDDDAICKKTDHAHCYWRIFIVHGSSQLHEFVRENIDLQICYTQGTDSYQRYLREVNQPELFSYIVTG